MLDPVKKAAEPALRCGGVTLLLKHMRWGIGMELLMNVLE